MGRKRKYRTCDSYRGGTGKASKREERKASHVSVGLSEVKVMSFTSSEALYGVAICIEQTCSMSAIDECAEAFDSLPNKKSFPISANLLSNQKKNRCIRP